jgi:hypothetical protein
LPLRVTLDSAMYGPSICRSDCPKSTRSDQPRSITGADPVIGGADWFGHLPSLGALSHFRCHGDLQEWASGASARGLRSGFIVLVVFSRWSKSSSILWIRVVPGSLALLYSVTVALSKIADANRMVTIHTGWETTSYAIGAGLAVAASIGPTIASVVQMRQREVPKYLSSDTSRETVTVC